MFLTDGIYISIFSLIKQLECNLQSTEYMVLELGFEQYYFD